MRLGLIELPGNRVSCHCLQIIKTIQILLTLFRMREGAKEPPTSFSPVTPANVRISPSKVSDF